MKTFYIKRLPTTDDGTFGVFHQEGIPLFVTMEEGWRNNAKGKSCILEASYIVKRGSTPNHPKTWIVQNVPDRTAILMHVMNSEKDSEGCIGLGMEFGFVNAKDDQSGQVERQPAILRSGEAFKKFEEMMVGENEFNLVIGW